MNRTRACCFWVLLSACSSGGHYATVEPGHAAFVVPHHIAEGKGEGADLAALPSGGSAARETDAQPAAHEPRLQTASSPPSGSSPDPEPLSMADQWEYQLLFQNGAPSVEAVEPRHLSKLVSTPRRMGRFALELWIGRELIDRVRFDFPLIAAEERPGITRRPLHDAPSLIPHAIARIRVSVPASSRATRLILVDRATGKADELAWPPDRESASALKSSAAAAPGALPSHAHSAPAPALPVPH